MASTVSAGTCKKASSHPNAAAALITQRCQDGKRDVAGWLADIEALRQERMRFVMAFSLEATDTIFRAEPVAHAEARADGHLNVKKAASAEEDMWVRLHRIVS